MTTRVTVEVPASANYTVAVATETPPLRGRFITYIDPGKTHSIHIHSGMKIVGIEEVPLGSNSNLHGS